MKPQSLYRVLAALSLVLPLPASAASPAPTITGYAATNPRGVPIFTAPPGAPMLILGANLGTSGTVAFNGIPAPPPASWSPTEIEVTVPTAPSYPFQGPVTVTTNGQTAKGPAFTVTGPPPAPPPQLRGYMVQAIVKLGDTVAGVKVPEGHLDVSGLNDKGQLVFATGTNGPLSGADNALLLHSSDQFTPIVVAGGTAPDGRWPDFLRLYDRYDAGLGRSSTVSINQRGNVAFATAGGLYLWDDQAQKVRVLAQPGTPVGATGIILEFGAPRINNHDEIVFPASVQNAAGQLQWGVFLRGQDEKLVPVVAPGQKLAAAAGNSESFGPVEFLSLSLNDAGLIAFLARSTDDEEYGYVWEKGTITNLGIDLDPCDPFYGVWLNNQDRSVLVNQGGALVRLMDGKLSSKAESEGSLASVSDPSQGGQHAAIPYYGDKVYLLNPDGKLSLILKTGMMTDLGLITAVIGGDARPSVGLNSQGQVAVVVQINGGPDTLVLLTPVKP
jgi:hypothetical protein